MSTSTVKLYYSGGSYGQWELLPGKLLKVDNISFYLATKSFLQVNTVQYQKLKLEMQLKLDLSQNYAVPLTGTTFKYLSIQNSDQSIHYYFVKKIDWASLSCVVFDLVLDVLNTFDETRDYVFKENTRIVREHKDRFKKANYDVTFAKENLRDHSGYIAVNDTVHFEIYGETGEHFQGTCVAIDEHGFEIVYENVDMEALEKFLNDYAENIIITNGNDWEWYQTLKIVDVDFSVYRNIDYIQEGINPILQCQGGMGEALEDKTPLNQHWHLLYRNVNDPSDSEAANLSNPVECYLIPEESMTIITGAIVGGRLNYSSLELGKVYKIPFTDNSATDIITLDDGTNLGSGNMSFGDTRGLILIYRNSNNRFSVMLLTAPSSSAVDEYTRAYSYESEYLTLNHLPLAYEKITAPTKPDDFDEWLHISGEAGSWSSGSTPRVTDSIDGLDRTDARNIKLIKLPYAPYDFTITGGKIDISSDVNWSFAPIPQSGGDCYALKLNDINTKLQHQLSTLGMTADPFWYLTVHTSYDAVKNASANDDRVVGDLESKLFNSEFFQPTYFYDSFQFKAELEKVDVDKFITDRIYWDDVTTITFTMTKTINSKFSFSFDDYYTRLATSNLPKVLPIARNNEEVLYNVPYLNYVRTGFNYDVKAKNLQNQSNAIGIGISGGTLALSLLLPSIPLKVAGVVGSLASMAMSVKGAIVSNQSAENSIQSKLTQARNQTDSVAGSDDVDLMTEYCGNRLRYIEYNPNPVMKSLLNDLFFYAGYRSDRMGLPNHNTRIHFDYLECEASLESIRSIPDDCLKELANSFKAGVTYIHYVSGVGWDMAQSKENWERSIL